MISSDAHHRQIIVKAKRLAGSFVASQAGSYFVKAVVLMASLMIVGKTAPHLPSVAFPFILVIYALLTTIGFLNFTVIKRLHEQYMYAENGRVSRIRRKWTAKLAFVFILFLTSGFLFVLEAPKWNSLEWALAWIAVPLYFIVFKLIQQHFKKELAVKFYKAYAMRWSFWVVGVILCLLYALIAVQFSTHEYSSLLETFQNAPKPYDSAPCALLCEAGKLSSFTDSLASYTIAQVSRSSFVIGLVCQFVTYAFVFFGLVNLFAFCLLDSQEIKREFQLLSLDDSSETPRHIIRRYVFIIAGLSLAFAVLFLYLEFEVAKIQATSEHTRLESFIEDQEERILYMVDGAYEKAKESESVKEEYTRKINDVKSERNTELAPLVNHYFDQCRGRLDAYLDWHFGPVGSIDRFIPIPLTHDVVVGKFKTIVAEEALRTEIDDRYADYQQRISALEQEALAKQVDESLTSTLEQSSKITSAVRWTILAPLNESEIREIVLSNTQRVALKHKMEELIEEWRTTSLSKLDR